MLVELIQHFRKIKISSVFLLVLHLKCHGLMVFITQRICNSAVYAVAVSVFLFVCSSDSFSITLSEVVVNLTLTLVNSLIKILNGRMHAKMH